MSPVRAILLPNPGRKPWVRHLYTFFEPRRGRYNPKASASILALLVPLLKELILLLSVDTQGFISGFALIPPWARQEYRA